MRTFITTILLSVSFFGSSQTVKVIEGDTVTTEVKYFTSKKRIQFKILPTCITKQSDTLNLSLYLEQNFVYTEEDRQSCNYDRACFKVYINKKLGVDSMSCAQPFLCYRRSESKEQLKALLSNIEKIRLEKPMREIDIQLLIRVKAKPPEPKLPAETIKIER